MKLAVCLYKYFPFGGLARDCLHITMICRDRGYDIDIYTMAWQGDIPAGLNINTIPFRGWTNHGRIASFINTVSPILVSGRYDLVIGFNKMPGLDLYYASDPCYLDRAKSKPAYFIQKLSRRMQFYIKCERAVFGKQSKTVSLLLSDGQRDLFRLNYGTPDNRLLMLPPGIDKSRKRPDNWFEIRSRLRHQFGIGGDDTLLLMIGTAFKTKGVDRAISALATLPISMQIKTQLLIIGDGNAKPYQKMARHYQLEKQVQFLGGRTDVPDFLLAADILLHPARKENTGTVILEAMVAGLPVLVTGVCGYAAHVKNADAGIVLPALFKQSILNAQLYEMLLGDKVNWSNNALKYADTADLYGTPEKVVDIIDRLVVARRL